MKKSIAMAWCEALESGEYGQTAGMLRRNGRFCCMGVLCNLHAQEHPEVAARQKRANSYMGANTLPPLAVKEWAGLADGNGGFYGYEGDKNRYAALTDLNDEAKLTFPEIAKIIRKHYKEL